jgi:putative colanic acid biosysnthesis UDP-glucose lipid carrier transferase
VHELEQMAAVPQPDVGRELDAPPRRGPVETALRGLFEEAPFDAAAHQTTQPILFKQRPVMAAIVLSLRAAAPPVVSSLTLYALAQAYNIPSTEFLSALTILVTVLSIVLLQPSRDPSVELLLSRRRIAITLIGRWAALLAVLAAIAYATGYTPLYPQQVILIWAAATPLLVIAATLALHEVARRAICHPDNHRSVVFVGYNEASRYLAERFGGRRELCMTVKGFFDDRSAGRLDAPTRVQILGSLADLPAYVKEHGVDVIFISLPLRHVRRVHDLVEALGDTTASLYYLPDVGASELLHARAGEILGLPVIVMRETPFYGYRGAAKRVLDLIIASGALLALAPLLLAIAVAVKLTSRGPVLFRQRRYGLDGREIVIYKFRTMQVVEDGGWLTQARRNDPRVTPLGGFLRRWSLDEFPQLINVLQGRMSLVGPRPHAIGHNEAYRRLIRGYMVRHKALPGITGLAQVKGFRGETRTLSEMQARVHYDLEYLRNWSLALDLKILLLTLPKLLNTDKAY